LEDIEIGIVRCPLPEVWVIPDPLLSMVSVSAVIPTLNEAANLPYVFDRTPREVFEVKLADGNSTDRTVEVAQRLWPKLTVIAQTGKGWVSH